MLFEKKIAIITPYYQEPRSVIDRAIRSVQQQKPCGYEVVHYLISDGHPQDFDDIPNLVHIKLPTAHRDFGDTPRLIGAMLAIRENCYGLMFLDADNLLYPDHLEQAISVHLQQKVNYVVARRDMLRTDGSVIQSHQLEEASFHHVDTGCLVFFNEGIYTVMQWIKIPGKLAVIGDRYFWNLCRKTDIQQFASIDHPTIGYECLWKSVYLIAGEIPPENAKSLDYAERDRFINQLTDEEFQTLKHRIHVT